MENKKQKFERLANARVNKALKKLDLIGNLANKNIYDYSENEVNLIINALDEKVKEVKTRFFLVLDNKQFKL